MQGKPPSLTAHPWLHRHLRGRDRHPAQTYLLCLIRNGLGKFRPFEGRPLGMHSDFHVQFRLRDEPKVPPRAALTGRSAFDGSGAANLVLQHQNAV